MTFILQLVLTFAMITLGQQISDTFTGGFWTMFFCILMNQLTKEKAVPVVKVKDEV